MVNLYLSISLFCICSIIAIFECIYKRLYMLFSFSLLTFLYHKKIYFRNTLHPSPFQKLLLLPPSLSLLSFSVQFISFRSQISLQREFAHSPTFICPFVSYSCTITWWQWPQHRQTSIAPTFVKCFISFLSHMHLHTNCTASYFCEYAYALELRSHRSNF